MTPERLAEIRWRAANDDDFGLAVSRVVRELIAAYDAAMERAEKAEAVLTMMAETGENAASQTQTCNASAKGTEMTRLEAMAKAAFERDAGDKGRWDATPEGVRAELIADMRAAVEALIEAEDNPGIKAYLRFILAEHDGGP